MTSYDLHIQGLLTLIRRKGGVHTIDHNEMLCLMLARYNSLLFASQLQ